jgi:hypothetical protein
VAEDELTTPRGEVEDKLRREVLGAFFDEQRLGKLRAVLNSPWEKSRVDFFATTLLEGVPLEGKKHIDVFQWGAIANLLAHVATAQRGQPLALHTREVFDKLIRRASHFWFHGGGGIKANWWGRTTDAIKDYGNAELLTDGFWEAIEQGAWAPGLLENVGDGEALQRLKEIAAKDSWPEGPTGILLKEFVNETAELMEMQFQYPELRIIKTGDVRQHIAERLRRMKPVKIEYLEEWARITENEEVAEALSKLAARLQKEANEANTGN